MSYVKPADVVSPKAHWQLFEVLVDRGEGDCAYALGNWDGERRVGFRWNGNRDIGPLGNPQSRGLPTWTMLDPALHEAVLELAPSSKRSLARNFLGLRSDEDLTVLTSETRKLHLDRLTKIDKGEAPCALSGGARLVLHVIPFSVVNSAQQRPLPDLFQSPESFPPISTGRRPSVGIGSLQIGFDGLLIGSNDSGLGEAQRAYVLISRSGCVECVTNISGGVERKFIQLPKVLQSIVRYSRIYASSLSKAGAEPPYAIFASLQNAQDARLLQDLFEQGMVPEDIPFGIIPNSKITFSESVLKTVPSNDSECAQILSPILNHISNTAGLPVSPCFGPGGVYLWKDAALL